MRSYRIDELQPTDVVRLGKALEARDMKSTMDDIYWLDLPRDLYSEEQRAHCQECGPYSVGVETGEDWIGVEFLVRARNRMRCSCVCYASPAQRNFVINEIDRTMRELDIPV